MTSDSRRRPLDLLGSLVLQNAVETVPESKSAPQGWVSQMALFIIVAALTSSLSLSAASFLAIFAVNHLGTTASIAAVLVAVLSSSGVWASPFGGYLCDRIGYVPAMLLSCVLAGPFIYLIGVTPYGALFFIILLIIQ